jgi:hypothetical protein
MLKDSKLSDIFWVQAVHIVVHILNKEMLRSSYIKREDNKVGKFDSRVDEGILVGYS